ncbi:hypothetical protein GCM10022237_24360 [Nocardioides ginsengisoli]|uniref:ABC transporter substrate-binding protein n=1 Tax=Nocardioides ginsengisoli TaxID=363868 RepID=A0ABW3W6R2_9ACTN
MNLKLTSALLASCLAAAALSGCSGGSGSSGGTASSTYDCSKPDADSTTKISVAGLPILTNGALYAGLDQGFFEKNGLDPEIELVPNAQGAIASLVGGNVDFAFVTTPNMLSAIDQGQAIRGVAPFAGIEPGYYEKMQAGEKGYTTGINGLLVRDDSGIDSPKDLEGKTVAVQDPAFSKLMVQWVIKHDGGDPDKVNYVLMPAVDAYPALQAGKVDAAYSFEPLMSGFEKKGLRNLSWLEVDVFHDGPMSYMAASNKYIDAHPDVVARFACAIAESDRYANQHPDEVRTAIARAQGVDPATYAAQKVSWFFEKPDFQSLDRVQDVMLEFGLLKKKRTAEELMAAPVLEGQAG